ncbi:MAG: penicillin acylase family protein [Candidatus Cyclobacteriaceae bacterium M2_1C_046]
MRIIKLVLLLGITGFLIYFLANPHKLNNNPVPPLGKFLDPFHGFWQNADENALPFPDEVKLEGLKESVTIVYDTNYVPHVFASNNEDLFYAQGYLMAQNRLWQMEFQIMAAAGRLSEILGENERILEFDRLQRRKGMVYGAERSAEKMYEDKEIESYADAFAEGVNDYIASLTNETLPVEYKLLDYKPKKWTKLKSALILEYMIDNLTGYDEDLENTNALAILGPETYNFLFPERVPGLDPTVPTDQPWEFEPVDLPEGDENFPYLKNFKVVTKSDPDNGSNNWAVSPEKSATGNAILANDPHLGLNLPSLWMMLHLNSPDYNVYGFTFPGALGVTIGFNDSISWGFTNAPRDTRDWYRIQFQDGSNTTYAYDSGWREADLVVEEIKIKGQDPFYDTVIYTHHGPIVYDRSFTGSGENLALRWGGHDGSMVQKTLLMLNNSNNYEDYKAALQYWEQPPQNVVFASVTGDIALTIAGRFPLKWRGQGKFIMEGSNPKHDWQGHIPMEHNAYQYNPERGFVSSANQHSVDEEYPYWFYSSTNEYFRNRRINRLLAENDSVTIKDVMDYQNDNYSIKAEEILPLLLDTVNISDPTEEEQQVLRDLEGWDYFYDADNVAPLYFNAWWSEFYNLLWDEFDLDVILEKPDSYVTIHLIKQDTISAYYDIQATVTIETLEDLANLSLQKAIQEVNKWQEEKGLELNWGNYKHTTLTHLARIGALGVNNVAISGVGDALNATKSGHGPSFRMIVHMTSPPEAWAIYPGGQSGNPGSPAYDNMVEEWRKGEYRRLLFPGNLEKAKEMGLKVQVLSVGSRQEQ